MSDWHLAVALVAEGLAGAFTGWRACRLVDSFRELRRCREQAAEWTPVDDDWLDSWGIRP